MSIERSQIEHRLLHDDLLTPILDIGQQLGPGGASVDVRLGHQFVVFNRATGFRSIDPVDLGLAAELEKHHQNVIRLGYGERFFLHPGDFVLARTFEYLNLPENWIAYVLGRSSWGRVGLVIATATFVNPGFKGTITLEIANLGQVPIVLRPLARIAQLVFHTVKPSMRESKDARNLTLLEE